MASGAASAAVTKVGSDAYGVSADVSLTLLSAVEVDAQVGPVNSVGGTAGPAYGVTGTVASLDGNLDLGATTFLGFLGLRQSVDTGVLTSTAQSPFPSSQSGSARSQVDNLNFTLGSDSSVTGTTILSLLGIRADTIVSRSVIVGGATPDGTGFTQIEGLSLAGGLFSSSIITAAAGGAFVNPGANTVLLGINVLGEETLRILLNEQIETHSGTSAAITTNAIHIIFSNYALAGVGKLRGDVVIGHTRAFIENASSATPEPAVWAQMITGFGLIGFATRRRRRAAVA